MVNLGISSTYKIFSSFLPIVLREVTTSEGPVSIFGNMGPGNLQQVHHLFLSFHHTELQPGFRLF